METMEQFPWREKERERIETVSMERESEDRNSFHGERKREGVRIEISKCFHIKSLW